MSNATLIKEKTIILSEYISCQSKILLNQSYTIKDRTYERADLEDVQRGIRRLQNEISRLESGGMKVRRFIPRD